LFLAVPVLTVKKSLHKLKQYIQNKNELNNLNYKTIIVPWDEEAAHVDTDTAVSVVMEVDSVQVDGVGMESSSSLTVIRFDLGLENRLNMFCCPVAGFKIFFNGIFHHENNKN